MNIITEQMKTNVYITLLIILAVLIAVCLIKSIISHGIANRIIAVNMIGTMVIMAIAILSVCLDESYLTDICLIYALASFIAVIVLSKVYTGIYYEKLMKKQNKAETDSAPDHAVEQKLKLLQKSEDEKNDR